MFLYRYSSNIMILFLIFIFGWFIESGKEKILIGCPGSAHNKTISSDPNVPGEVTAANIGFGHYLKEDYSACRIEKAGTRGVHITEFDPAADEILLV